MKDRPAVIGQLRTLSALRLSVDVAHQRTSRRWDDIIVRENGKRKTERVWTSECAAVDRRLDGRRWLWTILLIVPQTRPTTT
jgi:hypothetical protein